MRTLLLLTLLAAALSACSGGSKSSTSTATQTDEATAAAPEGSPIPSSTVGPPDGPQDRTWREPRVARPLPDAQLKKDHLVVYTDEVATQSTGGRSYPTLEIVTYDLDAGRIIGVSRAGAVRDYVYGAYLAGRSLVIRYEDRVMVSDLDGSASRILFRAPSDTVTASVAVSPDGALVAVAVEPSDFATVTLSFLSFLDVQSGKEVTRIPYDSFRAAGMSGTPGVTAWWGDNSAVEVYGVLHKGGGPRATGTAYRDGRVVMYPQWIEALSGDGTRAAYSDGQNVYVCDGMGGTGTGFRVIALPAGNILFTFGQEGVATRVERFSPDGRQVLFATFPLGTSGQGQPCFRYLEPSWHVLSGGAVSEVSDLAALIRGWEGPHFVETGCADPTLSAQMPGSWLVACGLMYDRPLANLSVGGKAIDQVHSGQIVGFLEPGP